MRYWTKKLKYETQLWVAHLIKLVPGYVGCALRNILLPYKNGKGVTLWEFVQIDEPSKLVIGDRVSINRGAILHAGGSITIGSDVLVGPDVVIYSQNHRTDGDGNINTQGYIRKPVRIGDNVWIASKAIILPGVHIGDGVVVGAGAVVTKDVPDNVVVAGNPASIIRRRIVS